MMKFNHEVSKRIEQLEKRNVVQFHCDPGTNKDECVILTTATVNGVTHILSEHFLTKEKQPEKDNADFSCFNKAATENPITGTQVRFAKSGKTWDQARPHLTDGWIAIKTCKECKHCARGDCKNENAISMLQYGAVFDSFGCIHWEAK